jgi:hypothetical protein
VTCGLICGFASRGSEWLLDRKAPLLTVATPASGTVSARTSADDSQPRWSGVSARRLRSWRSATSWLAAAVDRQHDQKGRRQADDLSMATCRAFLARQFAGRFHRSLCCPLWRHDQRGDFALR